MGLGAGEGFKTGSKGELIRAVGLIILVIGVGKIGFELLNWRFLSMGTWLGM
jgi:hypothetical protein